MLCLAASRSSHTATRKSCGHAPTVQQDALISGKPLCMTAHKAPNAHIVKAERCASTTLLLLKRRANSSIGIRTRMPKYLSRRLLAVTSGLSGSAPHAALSGKLMLRNVCDMTMAVLDATELVLLEIVTHSQPLKQRNTRCCLTGTLSATSRKAFIHKPPPLAAKSLCTGSAVYMSHCICGQLSA